MPGGVVHNLSPQLRDKISKIASNADMEAIERAYGDYSIIRSHSPEASRPIKNKLHAIAEQAVMLRLELETMSEEARDVLWDEICKVADVSFYQKIQFDLSQLFAASRQAFNEVEITEGNRRSTKQAFARNISVVLMRSDIPVNAKPNGALCQIVALLLNDFGDCPADVSALVRNAMRDNSRISPR